jgi:hypothetical protein
MLKLLPLLALIVTASISVGRPAVAGSRFAGALLSPFATDVAGPDAAVVLVAGKGGGTGGGAATGGMGGGATTGGMGGGMTGDWPGNSASPLITPISARPLPEDAPLSRQPRFARVRFAPVHVARVRTD